MVRKEIGILQVGAVLARSRQRFGRSLAATPIEIFPIGRANFDKVKQICGELRLLTPDRVRHAAPGFSVGFQPELSFFAGAPENPALILLGREHLGMVYLEILARNPEVRHFPRLGIMALLIKFWETMGERGLNDMFYQVTEATKAGLGPLLHRLGGKPTQFAATLRLALAQPTGQQGGTH